MRLIFASWGEKNYNVRSVVVAVVVVTPPLLQNGGTARTATQIHAVNLIESG